MRDDTHKVFTNAERIKLTDCRRRQRWSGKEMMESKAKPVRKKGAAVRVQRMVRRIFCQHEMATLSANRYSVFRRDGSKEGEVTLVLLECTKCGKNQLVASDRTHSPNEKLTNPAAK